METLIWVAYLTIGFIIGFRLSVIWTWREALRHAQREKITAKDWWDDPQPFFLTLGFTIGWPVMFFLWGLFKSPMLSPPKDVRKKREAEKYAELDRELMGKH